MVQVNMVQVNIMHVVAHCLERKRVEWENVGKELPQLDLWTLWNSGVFRRQDLLATGLVISETKIVSSQNRLFFQWCRFQKKNMY